MAKLIFTEEDERRIEELLDQFDPEKHLADHALHDVVPALTLKPWLVRRRREFERSLRAAMMAKAVAEASGMPVSREHLLRLYVDIFEAGLEDICAAELRAVDIDWQDDVVNVVNSYDDADGVLRDMAIDTALGLPPVEAAV